MEYPAAGPTDFEYGLLREVLDLTPNCVAIRDAAGAFIVVNQAQADLFGTTVEEMLGTNLSDYFSASRTAAMLAEDRDVLQSRRTRVLEDEPFTDPSGATRWFSVTKRAMSRRDGESEHVLIIAVDVTTRKNAEDALARSNDFLGGVMNTMNDAIFALDLSGNFTLVNRRLTDITGYTAGELIGEHVSVIFDPTAFLRVNNLLQRCALEGVEIARFLTKGRDKDGLARTLACSFTPLLGDDVALGVIATAEDVTEHEAVRHRVEHLTKHDSLTNLPNRKLFNERLRAALDEARARGTMVALLLLDFDRFKRINDLLGYAFGDQLITDIAARLQASIRDGDTLGRTGGDELMLVLTGIANEAAAVAATRSILETIRQPFVAGDQELVLTASIGLSLFPMHATEADALERSADVALVAAKRRGRDTFQIFDPSMGSLSLERLWFESSLRKAIATDEFELHYQPIVNLRTGEIHSLEALIRWRHPTEGLLYPSRFIELAEETALIEPLGAWVLKEACSQAKRWRDAGLTDIRIAINVSAHQFRGPLRESIAATLEETGLPAQCIELELTESTIMENAEQHTETMRELKALGLYISIDDFGTGYSSLSYLKRFPIDTLKIDRAFMPHPTEPDSGAIAAAVISMAHSLGLEVVAEGVETELQRAFLADHGCDYVQGFLHSRPAPADEVSLLLQRQR